MSGSVAVGVCAGLLALFAGVDAKLRASAPAFSSTNVGIAKGDKPPVDLVWLAGPASSAKPSGPAPVDSAQLRIRGNALFRARCASCHGKRGDGAGPSAASLTMRTPDFTKGVFKLRSTPWGTLPTPTDLFATISRGMHGTEMYPWSNLPENDRWALVYRVMNFSSRFKFEQPGEPFNVPQPPDETAALAAKGAVLYERHRCGACHGVKGGANGPAAELYKDSSGKSVVNIRDFQRGQFLRGEEMADIFLTLKTGLEGSPMGPYDALATQDLWALAVHVRALVQRRRLPLPDGNGHERP